MSKKRLLSMSLRAKRSNPGKGIVALLALFALVLCVNFQGCAGYTTKPELPYDIKTIYVPTIKNQIPLEDMIIYIPGMEVDMANAIIERFNFDGTLKVVSRKEDADATLYVYLKRFDQGGVQFTNLETVREYRLFITTDVQLKNNRTDENLLRERNFTGKASYFVTLSKQSNRTGAPVVQEGTALSLKEATQKAIQDYAHNVVDLVTEAW
jgi:hypothetical protein